VAWKCLENALNVQTYGGGLVTLLPLNDGYFPTFPWNTFFEWSDRTEQKVVRAGERGCSQNLHEADRPIIQQHLFARYARLIPTGPL
jgi:hypothetical protein